MKKWLAVLSAMMVLLCAVPFGAVAVSAAQTTQNVFRDGSFDTSYSYYWDYYQNTYICDDAALHGENGAYLQGNGGWGSMLEQTVAVELGRAYHLEFWYKVVNNGFNWRLEQGGGTGGGVAPVGDVILVPSSDGYYMSLFCIDNNNRLVVAYQVDCIDREASEE